MEEIRLATNYIVQTTNVFFDKLDRIHKSLENFSQDVNERRTMVFNKLAEFEENSLKISKKYIQVNGETVSAVDQILKETINDIQHNISKWHYQIESNKKGTEFMRTHEKYLVVMVFGSVKAGKSSLGNFFAGKYLKRADFDNIYQHREHPIFAMQEKGRNIGDVEKDVAGDIWFSEGVTDTTGAIQYYTLSGLRWMDSPGTGALAKDGDTRNMEEMVNEYIPYTDLCIFLMNSSEPGLQADMKYIEKLSRKGQEAIVVITKSDFNEEDEDDDGNLVSNWRAKSPENRKLQEDDICNRIKDNYPNISSEKFRAISVSTLLAKMAIAKHDDNLYKESNLDLLMEILGNKVSDEAIRIKEQKPKQNLDNFIMSIVHGEESFVGILGLDEELQRILAPIQSYRRTIKDNTRKISDDICFQVRKQVHRKIRQWADIVDKTGERMEPEIISRELSAIITPILQVELNKNIAKIIDNYQEQKMNSFALNFEAPVLEKQHTTISHNYTEIVYEEREADGLWENFRSLFGKKYYRKYRNTRTISKEVDLGTNVEDFLESIMPQIRNNVTIQVEQELDRLQQSYFKPQEEYVEVMRSYLSSLKQDLKELKFGD